MTTAASNYQKAALDRMAQDLRITHVVRCALISGTLGAGSPFRDWSLERFDREHRIKPQIEENHA